MTGQHSGELADRIAIVTRVDSPLGAAVALALAEAGADVALNGLNPARVDQIIEAIAGMGGRALGWNGDLSNRFQVSALIEAARAALGEVQIVVCVADFERRASVLQLDEYDWRRVLDLNLTSAFFFLQLAGRVMVDAGKGVLLVVTRAEPVPPPPESLTATSTAAGLMGLVRAAAADFHGTGVRVNLLRASSSTADPDLSAAIAYVCSDRGAALNGQDLGVHEVARLARQV